MKLQLTIGTDTPGKSRSALVPALKLALVGLAALALVGRKDIRRYLKLRRM